MSKIKVLVEDAMKKYIRRADEFKCHKESNLEWSKQGDSEKRNNTFLNIANEYSEEEEAYREKAKELKDELISCGLLDA
tara:strand:+ start:274 stop:510 length:237 start_codon:yes stop_codon:yes gene_type:complete